MNSGFRPLPASMPFKAKADIMIRRGEAKDLADARRVLRASYGRTTVKPDVALAAVESPKPFRLPYADN